MDTEKNYESFSSFKKFFFTGKANKMVLLKTGGCFRLAYVVTYTYTVAYFSIVFDICVYHNIRSLQKVCVAMQEDFE